MRPFLDRSDLERAPWASCAAASLAALLQQPLYSLERGFPPRTDGRTWTDLSRMLVALALLGVDAARTTPRTTREDVPEHACPRRGLVLLQFGGDWDKLPLNHASQLERTHWIAVLPPNSLLGRVYTKAPAVFDVNVLGSAVCPTGWHGRSDWEMETVPKIAASFGKRRDKAPRATGRWWVRAGIEIAPEARLATPAARARVPVPELRPAAADPWMQLSLFKDSAAEARTR